VESSATERFGILNWNVPLVVAVICVTVSVTEFGVSGLLLAYGPSAVSKVSWAVAPLFSPAKLTLKSTSPVLL
jgi:hypothetical protein